MSADLAVGIIVWGIVLYGTALLFWNLVLMTDRRYVVPRLRHMTAYRALRRRERILALEHDLGINERKEARS